MRVPVVLVLVMVVSFVVLLHLLQHLTSGDVPLVPLPKKTLIN